MPTRELNFAEISRERELVELESSTESFDRLAFAERAVALVRPKNMTVALAPTGPRGRVRVDSGRQWGAGDASRWAIVRVPQNASRRAIAFAVAELAGRPGPYVLDVLLGEMLQ